MKQMSHLLTQHKPKNSEFNKLTPFPCPMSHADVCQVSIQASQRAVPISHTVCIVFGIADKFHLNPKRWLNSSYLCVTTANICLNKIQNSTEQTKKYFVFSSHRTNKTNKSFRNYTFDRIGIKYDHYKNESYSHI